MEVTTNLRGMTLLLLLYTLLALQGVFDLTYVLVCGVLIPLLLPLAPWAAHPPASRVALRQAHRQLLLRVLVLSALGLTVLTLLSFRTGTLSTGGLGLLLGSLGTGLFLLALALPLYRHLGQARTRPLLSALLVFPLLGLFWWNHQPNPWSMPQSMLGILAGFACGGLAALGLSFRLLVRGLPKEETPAP